MLSLITVRKFLYLTDRRNLYCGLRKRLSGKLLYKDMAL